MAVYERNPITGEETVVAGIQDIGNIEARLSAIEDDIPSDTSSSNKLVNEGSLGTASQKDFTNFVSPTDNGVPISSSVFSAITSALYGAYHPSGSKTIAELDSSLLIQANVGNVYKITDSGVTTELFIGGAGQTINVGDNAVVVYDTNGETFKYDLQSGVVDLSRYQTKELETPLTIDGEQKTTVESALDALNRQVLYADNPIGTILPYGGSTIPTDWLLCDGRAVSRTTYSELFAVIGTAFGSGDGSTTFNLPDMRESVPVGSGTRGSGVADHDIYTVGQFKDDQLQDHKHASTPVAKVTGGNDTTTFTYDVAEGTGYTVAVGRHGTTTHGKQLGVNYIIKAKMVALPADLASGVEDVVDEKLEDTTAYAASGDTSKKFGALRTVHVPSGVTQREAFYSIAGSGIIYNQNNNTAYVIGHFGTTPINKITIVNGVMTLYNGDSAVTTFTWNVTKTINTEFRMIGVPYAI